MQTETVTVSSKRAAATGSHCGLGLTRLQHAIKVISFTSLCCATEKHSHRSRQGSAQPQSLWEVCFSRQLGSGWLRNYDTHKPQLMLKSKTILDHTASPELCCLDNFFFVGLAFFRYAHGTHGRVNTREGLWLRQINYG